MHPALAIVGVSQSQDGQCQAGGSRDTSTSRLGAQSVSQAPQEPYVSISAHNRQRPPSRPRTMAARPEDSRGRRHSPVYGAYDTQVQRGQEGLTEIERGYYRTREDTARAPSRTRSRPPAGSTRRHPISRRRRIQGPPSTERRSRSRSPFRNRKVMTVRMVVAIGGI